MSFRTMIVVGLALVCGLSAAIGVNQLRDQAAVASTSETVGVVSAAVDVPRGVLLTEDLLKTVEIPKSEIANDAITDANEALERVVVIPLLRGDMIREGKLAAKDAGRGMAALVPSGMRAYTILTPTEASGVGGFILPGNRVDVLLAVTQPSLNDPTGGGTAVTLLQNVEVLAVDQKIDAPAENKIDPKEMKSVTLLVSPDQANKLSLAQNKGTLHLTLRNDGDGLAAETLPVTLKDLRFYQEAPSGETAPAAGFLLQPKPKPLSVRTLRGRDSGSVMLHPYARAN